MDQNVFAEQLKIAMDAAGMKQADLIHAAQEEGHKLWKSQVSQYVSGKTIPRPDVMQLLAELLNVTPEWLGGEESAPMTPPEHEPSTPEPFVHEVQNDFEPSSDNEPAESDDQGSVPMRQFKKSSKLDNVLYDVRGPVVDEAARMESQGMRILKLNIGNPAPFGFRTPDEVVQDMRHQLPDCEGYSDSKGLFSARKAIMQYSQIKGLPNVDMDSIYTGNGVSELINLCMQALLDTGDEILIPSPDYPLWTACATLAGGTPVHYICDEQAEWYPDIDDIERKITPRTKAIVIINPNNPTGALYPREVLQQIVDIARKHQLMILSDEIYDRLVMDDLEHVSIASLAPDLFCITFSGLSKSHMIAGYRIGWMVLSGEKYCAQDFILGLNMLSNMRLCSNGAGTVHRPNRACGAIRACATTWYPEAVYASSAITCTRRSMTSPASPPLSPEQPSTSSRKSTRRSSTSPTTSSSRSICCTRRRSCWFPARVSIGVRPTTSAWSTCRASRCFPKPWASLATSCRTTAKRNED